MEIRQQMYLKMTTKVIYRTDTEISSGHGKVPAVLNTKHL